MNKKVLVTGAAGFIGFHLSQKLCDMDWDVTGIDNLNDYYDVSLKKDRLNLLVDNLNFNFLKMDLTDKDALFNLFIKEKFNYVINLAAQAGVRYSLINPNAYVDSNVTGFLNILECCRNFPVEHLIYASSSSVYGNNKKLPFSTSDEVDHPVSLYAATKKSNELMAHTYSHLFNIPTTGLRFFTVYGPWGRPDMSYFLFTNAITEGKAINVYNFGDMKRDFTYIDDIVAAIHLLLTKPPENGEGYKNNADEKKARYSLYNIGNNKPIELMKFIEIIESCLGKKAIKNLMPMQPGDVYATYADINDLSNYIGFKPVTNIEDGINKFVDWYRKYYKTQYSVPEPSIYNN